MLSFTSLFFFYLLFGAVMSIPCIGFSQATSDSSAYYSKVIYTPDSNSDITKAIAFFQRNATDYLKRNDSLSAAQALRLVMVGQYELGYYYESEETAATGLQLLDKLSPSETISEAKNAFYIQLGRVYRTLQNTSTSLYYYDKALAAASTARDSIIILNNKANVHSDAKEYQLAQEELALVYQLTMRQNDSLTIAKAQDNLGFVQSKLAMPQGLDHMQAALQIRLAKNDLTGTYSSYRHLAEYHMDRNQFEVAQEYAQKGYETATALRSASYLENALINLLKSKNDATFSNYLRLSDSLSKANLAKQNKYAGIKFNFEKEQERANVNELEKERQKRSKIVSQSIGGLVILSGVFLFFLLRNRHKKKTLQEVFKTETRISKKVHDEVANDVYHVMTKLQNSSAANEGVLDDLEHIYTKTRDISKESSAIELHDPFDTILGDLLASYQSASVSVITRNIAKPDWEGLSDLKKTTLYRVLQELMTNMRKHSAASVVVVGFSQKGSKFHIEYSDNGVGCDLKKKGGLLNTENRMETIKGHIRFESDNEKGFKATIIL
ncbi:hypothetical protein ATE92_0571 [Ulvibacter sp. MAR_2010_11]|nr:hypothetical protein ATE92_0571 [Ulvibacter sp. MAR_2010_11]